MSLYFHIQLTRRGLVDHLNIQCNSIIQSSSSHSHPTSRCSRSAEVELHLAKFLRGVPVVFCFAVGHKMLRLLSLCIRLPHFPDFLVFRYLEPCMCHCFWCHCPCLISFFRSSEIVDFIFPSHFRSSHCSSCFGFNADLPLPIFLQVEMLFSSLISISFFCVFRSSMGYWLLLQLCFSSCV